ncbi:MBL fold metallo-hydrolase [Phaeobacter inhibens]|uniref:MBL fold metallo-hydrolase n=1 Tax=Phaeobacter inhibens TaxID=221822 RepID=UPI0021A84485|nr:MBL fold metallo-hydrolase [Phaeobacter inhibens]UWR49779.1 MBL fold metallo-hydrolase [Phaeobacter inhibens]UWR61408.1 MBL fold metallo-hydrolase [Phaeobacter inhibens]UWR77042.1 MBL fold metallo-hydrolase [Phaeobacter inhibens]
MTINSGLSAWRSARNHNRMMEYRQDCQPQQDDVEIAYFGGSAFRITTPAGITLMIDPWRNLPTGKADWFFHDFPETSVDIGASTHAHFDHDALHRLDASVLLDRLIGTYEFGDLKITGIADKHATDETFAPYEFQKINAYFGGNPVLPPNNARSWDNCMLLVETGGLRVLHWGDNRHNPPKHIWEQLGHIDILLLPVDDSEHVLGYPMAEGIIRQTEPRVVIPHHYFIWNVVLRQSTLFSADRWLATQPNVQHLPIAQASYCPANLPQETRIDSFGDHVSFDVRAWHRENGRQVQASG